MVQPSTQRRNALHELGYKIFLDRYAQKDMTRSTLAVGDTVIVVVNSETGQREIGTVKSLALPQVTIELLDGEAVTRDVEHVDKPLETDPAQMMERVARGVAAIEKSPELQTEWTEKFQWLLEDFKFVPAGRILTAAGTNQALTYYNCFVLPLPKDSRGGIIETLRQMTEIMSRGGGVGMNLSSLRPRHAYVKGVNGRSSGSVSWGALYSFVTGLIEQGGSRRGALMLILNDWHPDVFDFINSKRTAGKITNANISVGVSDKLMEAVKVDGDWDLVFPDTSHPAYEEWNGELEQWLEKGYPVVKHRTVKAREVWNALTESAWASAEPGVWFRERSNKMSNSHYYASLVATNPCGEQSLAAWAVCNLGAINLARFYDETKHDVAWDDLDTAVRYATRFLDNVIDSTPYFFEENAKQQLGERRVGLNNMGLAELMIRLGIRYGSDESVAFIDKLYAFIARASYETSIGLAQEKGAFPQFDGEKFVQSGFMQSMPKDIRDKVRKNGIRNVTLLTQAPNGTTGTMVNTSTGIEPFYSWVYYRKSRLGLHEEQVPLVQEWYEQHPGETQLPDHYVTAMELTPEEHVRVQAAIQRWVDSSISKCVVGDTLILTDEGLQAIEELSEWREPDSFAPLHVGVMTSSGSAVTSAFYYNGTRPTIKVKLSYGYGLEGTTNHPIRVLQPDGTVVFKQLGDLRIGDTVPVYMGQRKFGRPNKPLPAYESNWNITNTKPIQIPEFMTNELAYLLGCITSEGSIGRNSVHFVNGDRRIVERVAQLFEDIFGIKCLIEQDKRRDRLWYVRANSRVLCRWLTAELGLMAGAGNKIIPACILTASAEEIAHFLRGLFLDSYMTLDGRMFGIGLASLKLLQQLQVLFLNFGIVSRLHKAGPNAWAITVAGEFLDKLAQITAFEETWKNERIARRNEKRLLKHRSYATLLPATISGELYQAAKKSRHSLRSLYPDQETDYQRVRVAMMRTTKIGRDDARKVYAAFADTSTEYLKNFFDADSEQCIYLEVKELQSGFAEVFDITVTDSHEFIANGISNHNTANLPNSYTIEQTRKLYEYMYELGCKGGTVYRDGSRDEQVLMLKGDERAESEMESNRTKVEQVTTPHYVYPRPKKLTGVTVNCKTPYGAAYITMNTDEQGHPFEVFITAPGKAGSDLHADAEGLGRLISLQLRTTAPQNRIQMIRLVVDQLKDIRGSRSYGMGPNRVFSLPDAVAGALLDNFFPQDKAQQLNLFVQQELMDMNSSEDHDDEPDYNNGNGHTKGALVGADICPSCGTVALVHEEGCKHCYNCGFSEC